MFAVSTAWSITHGGPAQLSVLAQYPTSVSPAHFYGPVSFIAEALLLKAFGLSAGPWRIACFLGVILTLLAAVQLVRFVGGDRWAQLAVAAMVGLMGSICTQLPGRWDFVTVGLLLSGLAMLLYAAEERWRGLLWRSVAAGILVGLAVGSTPRATPMVASAVLGILVVLLRDPKTRVRLLTATIATMVAAVVTQAILLAPLHLTPWGWLQGVRKASYGDRINSSPLLGGASWNIGMTSHKIVVLVSILLFVLGLCCAAVQLRDVKRSSWKLLLTVVALTNLAINLLTLSHPLGVAAFWLPLIIVAAFCWFDWRAVRYARLSAPVTAILFASLMVPAAAEAQRLWSVLTASQAGNPEMVAEKIRNTIPSNSVVYGPVGGYFFPVEQSGSHYFYLKEQTTPGLSSGNDSPMRQEHNLDIAACSRPTFLVWPASDLEGTDGLLRAVGQQVSARVNLQQHPRVEPVSVDRDGRQGATKHNSSDAGLIVLRLRLPESCSPLVNGRAVSSFGL